jgi:glycosyltransferase involved in cell wall biosynthesis
VYRALAATPGVDLTVYFAQRPSPLEQGIGFGVPITWDVDLAGGYASEDFPHGAPATREVIRRGRFDAFLVQGWNTRSYWRAIRACWATATPVLVRGDSQLLDDGHAKRWAKRAMYPRFIRRFAACLSTGVRSEAFFRYYGARRVVRAPHCVDNTAFAAGATREGARRGVLRSGWGIPPDRTVVLFAGKLVARKRPVDLVAALRMVPGTHALFVGDGPLRAACARDARKAGVPATFTGFLNQSEMPSAYAAADLLVLPSDRRETWGLVVNEAMASGRPVVVADAAGCVPDLVHDGVTGYRYPARDVGALAERVRTLVGDFEARVRMGAAAVTHIAGFSPEAAAAGVVMAATL